MGWNQVNPPMECRMPIPIRVFPIQAFIQRPPQMFLT
jgi:hypothetical protein